MGALLGAALQRAFLDGERIRFIQIGANDGVLGDPLYQYHVQKTFDFEWGHVFEAVTEYFDELVKNMEPYPYVKCHDCAVDDSAKPGYREFKYLSRADANKYDLPKTSVALGSFSSDRNALGGKGYSERKFNKIKPHIRTIQVKTVPAQEVVAQYADANFLLTDCEGYDLEIVGAMFNGTGFKPKVVQFEDLGCSEDLRRATFGELQAIGYQISRSRRDVICELAGVAQKDRPCVD